MSMHGLIIVNQQARHNEYKIKRFFEEFSKLEITLEVFKNVGTLARVENGDIVTELPTADFVLYLDKDIYLARELEKAGYRLFNSADFLKLCDDKMLTFIACSNMGIKMPETYAGPLVYSNNNNCETEFLKTIANKLGLPLVVKKVYGSLGEGVYKVNTIEELEELYKKICMNPLVFQKWINTSNGKSTRVLIIDGKVFGSFSRINTGDFRSNYGSTAGSQKNENNSKYHQFAQNIADKLNIEYAGIDLLDDENGEPILCEINCNAFFEEFEKVTGLNVAEEYAKMVEKKVKK